MKKIVLLAVVFMLLVIPAGCKKSDKNNGDKGNTNVNNNNNTNSNNSGTKGNRMVCTKKDNSENTTITVDHDGENLLRIITRGEYDFGNTASADMMLSIFSGIFEDADKAEGFNFSVKKTADGKGVIVEYDFDFSHLDYSYMQSVFAGDYEDVDWKVFNVTKYKAELTEQGYTCK